MLEIILQRLDYIAAGAQREPRTARTRNEEQQVTNRNNHEVYTYQNEEESTTTNEGRETNQPWTSRVHRLQQNTASYYTRSRSNNVRRTTPIKS